MKKDHKKIISYYFVFMLFNITCLATNPDQISIEILTTGTSRTIKISPNQGKISSGPIMISIAGDTVDTEIKLTYEGTINNNPVSILQKTGAAKNTYIIPKIDLNNLIINGKKLKLMASISKRSDASSTTTGSAEFEIEKGADPNPSKNLTNKSREERIKEFRESKYFNKPYAADKDLVYLYFDCNGKLLNSLPVNVDQNDKFMFNIVSQVGYEDLYSIKVIEGNYSPVDLSIRPHDAIVDGKAVTAHEGGDKIPIYYSFTQRVEGPFTSDYFEFQIAFDDTANKIITHADPYKIKINKLYHVGVGVSFVNTNLSKPDFKVAPLNDTANTIIETNNGNRTLITFNVIWYWSIFQNPQGNIITQGRDILKDEPAFSIRRVFPTIGVSLDGDYNENFFLGAAYEFARGGSIVLGYHYGKVEKLADDDFVLGTTPYSGSEGSIIKEDDWKSAFFIGINVDTRIFNALFSGGK